MYGIIFSTQISKRILNTHIYLSTHILILNKISYCTYPKETSPWRLSQYNKNMPIIGSNENTFKCYRKMRDLVELNAAK
jgi:hypothetical protein